LVTFTVTVAEKRTQQDLPQKEQIEIIELKEK
jgi:hypothetical protein